MNKSGTNNSIGALHVRPHFRIVNQRSETTGTGHEYTDFYNYHSLHISAGERETRTNWLPFVLEQVGCYRRFVV